MSQSHPPSTPEADASWLAVGLAREDPLAASLLSPAFLQMERLLPEKGQRAALREKMYRFSEIPEAQRTEILSVVNQSWDNPALIEAVQSMWSAFRREEIIPAEKGQKPLKETLLQSQRLAQESFLIAMLYGRNNGEASKFWRIHDEIAQATFQLRSRLAIAEATETKEHLLSADESTHTEGLLTLDDFISLAGAFPKGAGMARIEEAVLQPRNGLLPGDWKLHPLPHWDRQSVPPHPNEIEMAEAALADLGAQIDRGWPPGNAFFNSLTPTGRQPQNHASILRTIYYLRPYLAAAILSSVNFIHPVFWRHLIPVSPSTEVDNSQSLELHVLSGIIHRALELYANDATPLLSGRPFGSVSQLSLEGIAAMLIFDQDNEGNLLREITDKELSQLINTLAMRTNQPHSISSKDNVRLSLLAKNLIFSVKHRLESILKDLLISEETVSGVITPKHSLQAFSQPIIKRSRDLIIGSDEDLWDPELVGPELADLHRLEEAIRKTFPNRLYGNPSITIETSKAFALGSDVFPQLLNGGAYLTFLKLARRLEYTDLDRKKEIQLLLNDIRQLFRKGVNYADRFQSASGPDLINFLLRQGVFIKADAYTHRAPHLRPADPGVYPVVPHVKNADDFCEAIASAFASIWSPEAFWSRASAGITPLQTSHTIGLIPSQDGSHHFSMTTSGPNQANLSIIKVAQGLGAPSGYPWTNRKRNVRPATLLWDKSTDQLADVGILPGMQDNRLVLNETSGGIRLDSADPRGDFSTHIDIESAAAVLGELGKLAERTFDGPRLIKGIIRLSPSTARTKITVLRVSPAPHQAEIGPTR